MSDTSFAVPVSKVGRLAKPFQKDAMGERDPTSQRGRDGGAYGWQHAIEDPVVRQDQSPSHRDGGPVHEYKARLGL